MHFNRARPRARAQHTHTHPLTPRALTSLPLSYPSYPSPLTQRLVINKKDQNRVVGFHVLGPNSGEITQGWACAVRLGATYESFLQTVGIHPTSAEEFTQLTVTKSSGESADKGNC